MLILAAIAAAAPHTGTAPMQPAGKRTVEFADTMCGAARNYGAGREALSLILRPLPGDPNIEILLLRDVRGAPGFRKGMAKVALAPSGQAVEAEYKDYRHPKMPRRVTRFYIERESIGTLFDANEISIAFGRGAPIRLALRNMAPLRKVLDNCGDDLLRQWGLDPAVFANVAQRQKLVSGSISDYDYPAGAIQRLEGGTVVLFWTITANGVPADCRVVLSSGHRELDDHSCNLISKRFRYEPARDKDGKAVPSMASQRITWNVFG